MKGTIKQEQSGTCSAMPSVSEKRGAKGTDHFKNIIKAYLDTRAQEDELFRAEYETIGPTILPTSSDILA